MTRKVGYTNTDTLHQDTQSTKWESALDANERLLWKGQPGRGMFLRPKYLVICLFCVVLAGFILSSIIGMAALAFGAFWMLGLSNIIIMFGIVFFAAFGGTYLRKRIWYILTNKRALIFTNMPVYGERLKSFPIDQTTNLKLHESDLPSVYFGKAFQDVKNIWLFVNIPLDIGFECIADGREVYNMMRRIQEGRI